MCLDGSVNHRCSRRAWCEYVLCEKLGRYVLLMSFFVILKTSTADADQARPVGADFLGWSSSTLAALNETDGSQEDSSVGAAPVRRLQELNDGDKVYLRDFLGGYMGVCGTISSFSACDGASYQVLTWRNEKTDRTRWVVEIDGTDMYLRHHNGGYLGVCGAKTCDGNGWAVYVYPSKRSRCTWFIESDASNTYLRQRVHAGGAYLGTCGVSDGSSCGMASGWVVMAWPSKMDRTKYTIEKEVTPTKSPTAQPTSATTAPTAVPTAVPTATPTAVPTSMPTAMPTAVPTSMPTAMPTALPTSMPTSVPTDQPTNSTTASSTNNGLQPTNSPATSPQNPPDSGGSTLIIVVAAVVVVVVLCSTLVIVMHLRKARARAETLPDPVDTVEPIELEQSPSKNSLRSTARSTDGAITKIRVLISSPERGLNGEPIMANLDWIGEQTKAIVCAFDRAGAGVTNFGSQDAGKFNSGAIGDTMWAASYIGRISGALGPVTQWEHRTVLSEAFRSELSKEIEHKHKQSISFDVSVTSYLGFLQKLDAQRTIHGEPLLQDLREYHFAAVINHYIDFSPFLSKSKFKAKIQAARNAEQVEYLVNWQRAVEEATKKIDDKYSFELRHGGVYEISTDPTLMQSYKRIDRDVDNAQARVQYEFERAKENICDLFKGMAKAKEKLVHSSEVLNAAACTIQTAARGKLARNRVKNIRGLLRDAIA
eukprot:TRINITY_DN8050_c0_g1_i3.p1 TRINITY_DN8050_c0_g1~~TRINITY_DN8050_c0_g1_i3.p1  ORF type:complete len:709 (+),score=72.20 TRINITY_DN8050_c0_g1_i3:81-2207(+)